MSVLRNAQAEIDYTVTDCAGSPHTGSAVSQIVHKSLMNSNRDDAAVRLDPIVNAYDLDFMD